MILPVSNQYRIRADQYNWIVQKRSGHRRNQKSGGKEPNWKDIGYFTNLQSATGWLHQHMIKVSSVDTMVQALNKGAEALALISTALERTIREYQERIGSTERDDEMKGTSN